MTEKTGGDYWVQRFQSGWEVSSTEQGSAYTWVVKDWKLIAQLCPSLCDPMDSNPPGSSVHGILQARTLEWVAIPFSRGSFCPRDWTQVSCIQTDSLLSEPPRNHSKELPERVREFWGIIPPLGYMAVRSCMGVVVGPMASAVSASRLKS